MRGTTAVVCAALLVAAGCSADRETDQQRAAADTTQTSTAPASASTVPEPVADLGSLDGALREQSQWVLDQLAPEATGPSATEAADRFSSTFLTQVRADQLEPVFATFREGTPLALTGVGQVQESPGGGSGTQLTLAGDRSVRVSISVDTDGLISGLLLQPGPPTDLPELTSWSELDEELAALGGTARVFVGEVTDGTCSQLHVTGGQAQPVPSGSAFKLIVLAAVVEAVEDGDLAWDEDLTITAKLKSLPSGELQNREDGSTVPVREAAGLMISVSDNTATDLLMEAVGAERLRAMVERISDDPDRLTPLLSTRQFFQLGWNAPEVREQWAGAGAAERQALLEDLPTDLGALRDNPFAVTEVTWPEGVGWFLTGEELCSAHAVLQQQAGTEAGQPVREILSANPGLPPPEAATYQGFKGGSAPGVLAYSFYLESEEITPGRVLTVQVSHERAIMPTSFTELTQAGLQLLATAP
ncbi:serine hydrolase [Ornithinimicrobium murale]|uniref:serine hydrolase n=1 Tax=Ornithinimicrobium murale TaxID=1050153 RepID=UPI000E0CDB9A|nr:serine hydrolase [Ornithinimicrobium murale]